MADFIAIPLPEEHPLDIIVEDETAKKVSSRGRKKKTTEEAPAPEAVSAE